ncbi:MAG TPA: aspartate carbamoyltransferase [Candidatus Saccharimonadales bacterium]|jgi:aspartate carbamoyltransferase
MKDIISVKQLQDKKLLSQLFERANYYAASSPINYPKPLLSLTIASVFFEPSTRTRLSFETAAQNLGAQLLTVENAGEYSSVKKGESLEDTIRTIQAYADGIIIRHPEVGSADQAAKVADVPIINAGDGGGEHPTQALLDLYSIEKAKGKIDGLKIALVGDLEHSRTQHSLLTLLSIFDVELYLVSPKSIGLPDNLRSYLKRHSVKFKELYDWQDIIPEVDVLYINRIQKERFAFPEEYQNLKDSFRLTTDIVKRMKKNAIILDPLPRVNEIDPAVDDDPRAKYFEQVKNGLYVRMALLEHIFAPKA